jgi:hypothetical protein
MGGEGEVFGWVGYGSPFALWLERYPREYSIGFSEATWI